MRLVRAGLPGPHYLRVRRRIRAGGSVVYYWLTIGGILLGIG